MKQLREQEQPKESKPSNRRKSDILWKVVMEEVFDDLLRFIFPDADRVYNMERGFEFLDKELAEMYPKPVEKSGTLFADKLVKVFTRDGHEEWVLFHVEVQGYTKAKERPLFPGRMFRYFARVWGKHQKPVSAVAIFTGSDGKRMPNRFTYEYRNTRVIYEFPAISILDYTDEELEKSNNPFAQVVLAARASLLEGKIPEQELLDRKVLIAGKLLRKSFPKKKIWAIFRFLENHVLFKNPEMNLIFKERIHSQDKNNVMGIEEYVKMVAKEEGLEEGLEEGQKKGIKKGIKKGRIEEKQKRSQLFVKNLSTRTDFSVKKIADLACVTEAFVKKVQKGLKSKTKQIA